VIESKQKTAITLKYPLRNTAVRHARDIKYHLRKLRECNQFSNQDYEHYPELDSHCNWIDFEWMQLQTEEKGYKQFNPTLHDYKTKNMGRMNNRKNRYPNILPYDWSKVSILYGQPEKDKQHRSQTPGERPNDRKYINANHIGNRETQNRGRTYIATQGPIGPREQHVLSGKSLPTREDFWCMVVTKKPKFIIAAVNLVEDGRQKCDQYWPTLNKSYTFKQDNGDEYLRIETVSETPSENKDWVTRRIKVVALFGQQMKLNDDHNEGDGPHQYFYVTQYHFKKWPDHGVLEEASILVNFMKSLHIEYEKLSNKSQENIDYEFVGSRGQCGPLVVHCSAGVGRTGTIIAIDMILDKIRWYGLDTEIDVFKTVQKIREHRMDMVQSKDQYEFIYKAVDCFVDPFILRSQTTEEREYVQSSNTLDTGLEISRFNSRRRDRTIRVRDNNNN